MRALKTSGMALAILLAMTACSEGGNSPRPTTSAPPATFEVTGAIDVTPDFTKLWATAGGAEKETDGVACEGERGYDDIAEGAQVAVRDGAGKVVAIGQLSGGIAAGLNCTFTLTVAGVPKGSVFYSVEVAHRGQVQYTAAKIQQPLSLNLK